MSKKTIWKFLSISFLIAFTLSGVSILFLNRIVLSGDSRHRDEFVLFWADEIGKQTINYRAFEIKNHPEIIQNNLRPPMRHFFSKKDGTSGPPHDRLRLPPPPPDMGPPPGDMGPPPFMRGDHNGPPIPDLWLVTENGEVLQSNSKQKLSFKSLKKPLLLGEVATNEDFFKIFPPTFVVKLPTQDGFIFWVFKDNMKPFFGYMLLTQALLSFATLIVALGLALILTFFYLRKKSLEAREVLLKLEQGDLKARFPIQKFDEFGSLLLDFNRMAEEIEKLVNRLHLAETTRKNLLQELGHDVRTPLTTIRTSIETLKAFADKMSSEEKMTMYNMLDEESLYMGDLFEKLMTIATLDEPHYKKTTEVVNMEDLLRDEIDFRKNSQNKINWVLESKQPAGIKLLTSGDSHLLLRMIKNSLDNASRFAQKEVRVVTSIKENSLLIAIADDGEGFTAESLKSFGERREFSARQLKSSNHVSLGLGSVIMKAIAELHDGSVVAQNNPAASGAIITLRLPLIPQS